jgi:ribonuclease P protein component
LGNVSQRFLKTARLRKRAEFLALSRTGVRLQSANFIIIIGANGRRENRLGITVSGKVGNSVTRNRLKRSVREYFRRHRAELPTGSDILIIARSSAADLDCKLIASELRGALAGQRKHHR